MKFDSTRVPNLVKGDNGSYYVRARVAGKLIWRSLDTDSFTVAKLRLPDKVSELRRNAGMRPVETRLSGSLTFGEALQLYQAEVNQNPRLKPRTKDFRLRS